jgi:hypothetical protein
MHWLAILTSYTIVILMAFAWRGDRSRSRKLERAMARILRTRYTHPEELSAELSEAEVEFPELAPAGTLGVTDSKGEFILRRDATRPERPVVPNPGETFEQAARRQRAQDVFGGHQPLPGAKMPPPPAPKVKPAPDQDGKTIESCKARFSDHMNTPFGEPPIVKAKTPAADPLVSVAHKWVLDTVYEGPIEGLIDSRSAAEAAKDLPYEKEVLRVLVKHGLITKP